MFNIFYIFKREIKSYFSTPIAVIFLVVFLIISGFFTFKLGGFYEQGYSGLNAFFSWHPWLFLFIVPAISMRLWAEEKRSGTIELIFTLPISTWEAMLGKFFASWFFLGFSLLLTFPIVLTVMFLGVPDMGVILAGYLGSFLMAGAFLSIGINVSASTKNQVISFVLSTAICLILILIGFNPVVNTLSNILPSFLVDELSNLSFPYHFEAIRRGVIDLRDILYFVSIILFFLTSGVIVLEKSKA